MTPADTAELLATVQAYDRRTVGEVDVAAWHLALGDLPLDDCRRAVVSHFAHETSWLMPAHVRKLVTTARQDRADRAIAAPQGIPKPPGFVETVQAALAEKAETIDALRRGRKPGTGLLGETIAGLAGAHVVKPEPVEASPVDESARQRELERLAAWHQEHPTAPAADDPERVSP